MELSLNKLTRRYGEMVAVDDASIVMERGVYGLLGVNGAGKTTLMRMVTTLIRPSQGSITYDGKDISSSVAPTAASWGTCRRTSDTTPTSPCRIT